MPNKSPANKAASSPPVPARTSRIALRASSASFGKSSNLSACSSSGICDVSSSISSSAISIISLSVSPSAIIALASSIACVRPRTFRICSATGLTSANSRDNFVSSSGDIGVPLANLSSISARRASTLSIFSSSDMVTKP